MPAVFYNAWRISAQRAYRSEYISGPALRGFVTPLNSHSYSTSKKENNSFASASNSFSQFRESTLYKDGSTRVPKRICCADSVRSPGGANLPLPPVHMTLAQTGWSLRAAGARRGLHRLPLRRLCTNTSATRPRLAIAKLSAAAREFLKCQRCRSDGVRLQIQLAETRLTKLSTIPHNQLQKDLFAKQKHKQNNKLAR
jgi:hypothetical protein